MSNTETQYLSEMGIQYWQLTHPERLTGYQATQVDLPESCQLLLVAPSCPRGETAAMFARVLKSIKLELGQARHILPDDFSAISEQHLKWIWFAGCDVQAGIDAHVLHTPMLSDIDGNNTLRRALWQQICSYQ
ncbi:MULTISPECIES: DNA polymerase III subunit psi [Vibrio]|uniref:DNA polymerase III subunit psi n=1 Tax=Vibrio proteolyticus NBRC 13287 TaxID=1219065 RepID=U3A2V6_VIBPR|nr:MULTISPECIES: DNA polymerase III subunit psi [Vibrio]NAW58086.1 DNA polymerase III subunit psi [Vibrio sp. V36_P2S2PM302]NAX22464.1 DNA polymerase III subunit psi [Vibrio sp. V39_P1S14PM300]NAX25225.1 DNA polymerase III subunit psi [Vibrio sp. V38_P2S17PM301]NAX28782.1 DNA polymerase III subunit psi [Vibrio sp. V37_P2S8PM304]GAD67682.1 DNA polymerase III subunit psi [Vibrio proteolyticus NBRC 13287]